MAVVWKECPHCKGKASCSCPDCGTPYSEGSTVIRHGICKVCAGEGGWHYNTETGEKIKHSCFEPKRKE